MVEYRLHFTIRLNGTQRREFYEILPVQLPLVYQIHVRAHNDWMAAGEHLITQE